MTSQEFVSAVSNGGGMMDVFLGLLSSQGYSYCVIGGLAVNAYAEPLVSLDLDIVFAIAQVEPFAKLAAGKGFKVESFPHSVNLALPPSELRIQIQTDERYQQFLQRAALRNVLGYEMLVASLEDVLQGKLWAYSDSARRMSKRQKDLADIIRLAETYPALQEKLPNSIKEIIRG